MSEMKTAYLVLIRETDCPDSEIERFELADSELAAQVICDQNYTTFCEKVGPLPIETVESLK